VAYLAVTLAQNPRASTFSGSCKVTGQVTFQPPLTNTPQPIEDRAHASGSCSGNLVDRSGRAHKLENAPVTYLASDKGTSASCAASSGANGSGELRSPTATSSSRYWRGGPALLPASPSRVRRLGLLKARPRPARAKTLSRSPNNAPAQVSRR